MVKTCVGGTEGRSLPDVCYGGPGLCGVQGQGKFPCRIQTNDEIIKQQAQTCTIRDVSFTSVLFNLNPFLRSCLRWKTLRQHWWMYRKLSYYAL